jgi:aldehyde:ferredoxin oxidoreductase
MELTEKGVMDFGARFGDTKGAWRLMEDITHRRGAGSILAEGTRIAARKIGNGAERYAMQVKGLEMVCFEPRSQTNLAMGYATAPIGPRYDICEHDWDFDTKFGWEHSLNFSRTLGILERIPMNDIRREKVRNFKVLNNLWSAADALDLCIFAVAPTRLLSMPLMAQMIAAVTGWETSDYELIRIGERRNHLMRW